MAQYHDRANCLVLPTAYQLGGASGGQKAIEVGTVTFTTTTTQATVVTKLSHIESGQAMLFDADPSSVTQGTALVGVVRKAVTQATNSHRKTFVIERSSTGAISGATFSYIITGRYEDQE